MSDDRPHLLGLLPADLVAHLRGQGVALDPAHARRLLAHRISRGRDDLQPRTRLPARALQAIADTVAQDALQIVQRASDPQDSFVKYLLQAPDHARFEAVRIPLERPGRYTVCLSAQVGCNQGCAFCATGRQGLTRSLAAWEMVASWLAVRADTDGRVSGAVFMGQGEPLQNRDAVIQAARVLSDPCGGRIRQEAISISTAGPPAAIRRYTREGHRYRLIVSLTSAIAERRAALMPAAGQASLSELAAAVHGHARATGERVSLAWVLLGGVNTGADELAALGRLLDPSLVRLNLIDVNPTGDEFVRASDEERAAFHDGLRELGIPVVRRYSGGVNAHAACGMLTGATRP